MNETRITSRLNVNMRRVILSLSALVLTGVVAMGLRLMVSPSTYPKNPRSHWSIGYTIKFRPNGEAKVQWAFLTYPESEFFVAAALVLVGSFKESKSTMENPAVNFLRTSGSGFWKKWNRRFLF